MSVLTYIVLFSLLGGLLSLIGGVILLSKKSFTRKFAFFATPFAAGALLAAVFFDLLPEGVHIAEPQTVFTSAAAGILTFFVLERWLHYFHHHRYGEHTDKDPNRFLIIVGDTLHNAIDGVVIAAGFLVSIPTGIATTFAVVAHEIPQEIGDFGLLLSKGMSRARVLLVNILSSLATAFMAVVTYFVGSGDRLPIGVILGLSAGFLLYIAMSDIIPFLNKNNKKHRVFDWQVISLFFGALLVALLVTIAHSYIDDDHGHGHGTPQQHDRDEHHDDEYHDDDRDEHHDDDGDEHHDDDDHHSR